MSRAPRFFTQEQISKRIKSGRGQGMGKDYQPWLTIQDVPSRGVSHRIYSHKTQRVHHLLSNLELYVFLILDWSSFVQDIREQFPLNLDDKKRNLFRAWFETSQHTRLGTGYDFRFSD